MYQSSGVLDAFSSIYSIAQLLKFLPLFFLLHFHFFPIFFNLAGIGFPYTYLGFRWTVVSFTFLLFYMVGMLSYSVDCSSEQQNVWATLNLLFWNAINSEYSDGAFWISSFLSSKQRNHVKYISFLFQGILFNLLISATLQCYIVIVTHY